MKMFNYKWYLKDGYKYKNGLKVFSTFACGGGSSMGYKLAGYDVIGANDIDPQMAKVYKKNHNPKYFFECPIKDMIIMDLPNELYNLDILDGSPPCSTFSIAGSREKSWGKKKMFREGQSEQILDDLFFDFIKLVERLKPKVVIAENVKGMLLGNAKGYLIEIKRKFIELGYNVQIFLFNGVTMGLPQKRERVFIICNKMNYPKLRLDFKEKPISLKMIEKDTDIIYGKKLSNAFYKWWKKLGNNYGSFSQVHPKGSFFNTHKCNPFLPLNTITSTNGAKLTHYKEPYELSNEILKLAGSFPLDYNFLDIIPKYLIGMSVPPIMMAQISKQIELQWFIKN